MTPRLKLFILIINLALVTEQYGQVLTVPILESFTNHQKLGLSRFNRGGLNFLQKSNPSSFQSEIEFEDNKGMKTFNRLEFLSAYYQNKYLNRFKDVPPLLFSSHSKGHHLVNLLTTDTPTLMYHTRNGHFRFQNNKSEQQKWLKEKENKPILDYCITGDAPIKRNTPSFKNNNDLNLPTVSIYLEIDYYTYQEFNEDEKAINDWAILLFAEVASVYAIDDIPLQLEDVFIWTEEDPFDLDSGAVVVLNQFNEKILTDGPNADAHLLLSSKFLHGIANLESLCGHTLDNPIASAGIATGLSIGNQFNQTYNWSIYVIAHELGHILGSRHTHACVWIDGTQALDDCGQPEGSCIQGPRPPHLGGTIMSYCHYWSTTGINFSNGFGNEPSSLIKSHIINMPCSVVASNISCSVGSPCDDNNSCTNNDQIINENCECIGVLIDFNMNGICDNFDECPNEIEIDSVEKSLEGYIAKQTIMSTTEIESGQTVYFSAGQEIILSQGFEVNAGAIFESQLYGCENAN